MEYISWNEPERREHVADRCTLLLVRSIHRMVSIHRSSKTVAARFFFLLMLAPLLFTIGCKGFFVPICVETNSCPGSCASTITGAATGTGPTINTISPTTGVAGTTVTISGANFTGATSVQFGNVTAPGYTVNTAGSQITVAAPAGTGAVSISVTASGGISNCVTFTYNTPASTSGSGGSSGSGSSATAGYVYVANENSGTIAGFSLSGGKLTALTGSPYALGTTPSALAATPDGTRLYMASPTSGGIFLYTIGSTGEIAIGNSQQALVTTSSPTYMAVDTTGSWLFVVSSLTPAMVEYQINPTTGALTPVAGNTYALNGGTPTQIYITPNDKNLYVALGTGGVDSFGFTSSTGALNNHANLASLNPSTNGDNALGSDSNSKYLFVGETGSGIRAFTIGANAALTPVSGSPFPSSLGPSSIAVDPTSTYVYVTSKTSSVITGYTLSSSGSLALLSTSPFLTGRAPIAISLDPTGKYVVVASSGDYPDIEAYSFDSTSLGKLDSSDTQATGTDPTVPISMAVVK